MKNLKKILLIAIAISASGICFAQEHNPFAPLGEVEKIENRNAYRVTCFRRFFQGMRLEHPVPVVTINPGRTDRYKLTADSFDLNRLAKFTIDGKVALFRYVLVDIPTPVSKQNVTVRGLVFLRYKE